MAVITISRETGCGGSGIAARLAERLGYHLADKETIGRILAEYGFVTFKETYETEPSFWTRFNLQTGAMTESINIDSVMSNSVVGVLGCGAVH